MNRRDGYAIVVGFLLAGCVSASYAHYNLQLPDGCYRDGKLLAHNPKDDLPLTVCQPDAGNKMKCVTLLSSVYERQLIDLSNCQLDLNACESRCQ
jgi:hypothetical protein